MATASLVRDATTLLAPLNDVKLLNMILNKRLKEELDDTISNAYMQNVYSTPLRSNPVAAGPTLAAASSPQRHHSFKRLNFSTR